MDICSPFSLLFGCLTHELIVEVNDGHMFVVLWKPLCFYNGRFAVSDSVCNTFLDSELIVWIHPRSRLVVLLLFVFEAGAGLWHHTCLFVEAMTHLSLRCIVKGCCRPSCSNLLHFVRIHREVTVCTLLLLFLLSSTVSIWTQPWFLSGMKNIICMSQCIIWCLIFWWDAWMYVLGNTFVQI